MELFASPMACSLASHITALEAGLPVKVRFIDNKKTDDGGDYYKISVNGYVPALRLDDGQILNEGPSVLPYFTRISVPEIGYGVFAVRNTALPVVTYVDTVNGNQSYTLDCDGIDSFSHLFIAWSVAVPAGGDEFELYIPNRYVFPADF